MTADQVLCMQKNGELTAFKEFRSNHYEGICEACGTSDVFHHFNKEVSESKPCVDSITKPDFIPVLNSAEL